MNDAVDILADTLVVEGLEDLLSLAELGRAARLVGLPGIGTLRHLPVKEGERITVFRDGDEPGSGADKGLVAGVDHLLLEGAVVRVTSTPNGQDANDVLLAGGLVALRELIAGAEPATLSRDGEITRLSRLDRLAYDAERKAVAGQLGIRVPTLDQEVAKRRPKQQPADDGEATEVKGPGRPVEIPVIEPWPAPVDGAALLSDIASTLRQYVCLEPHQADAIALWSLFSHAFDAFEVAPKLVLESAEMRSGKSKTLRVLRRVVARPLMCSGITPAAMLRLIERDRPCLLLDEVDAVMQGSPEAAETLRGIINSGFDLDDADAAKLVPIPGGDWEPRLFSAWCPQVLAGIGKLPATIADRMISIHMQRKRTTDKVRPLRRKHGADLEALARKRHVGLLITYPN